MADAKEVKALKAAAHAAQRSLRAQLSSGRVTCEYLGVLRDASADAWEPLPSKWSTRME